MPVYGKSHHRKRSKKEYEKEIADAVKRFKKYPERMKYAGDSEDWINFLLGIGIYEDNANSDFFEDVRLATLSDYENEKRIKTTTSTSGEPRMISNLIKVTDKASVYLDTTKSVSQYREVYSGFKVVYRNPSTGRFEKRNY